MNYTAKHKTLAGRHARAQGILPLFAVGNEGPGTSRSPGNYVEALSVGATDRDDDVALFSSSQRFDRQSDLIVPDLVAPGVSVISARPGGGSQSMDGTSMATPHTAGLAALLLEAKPDATVDEELDRQLAAADASDEAVEAVIMLERDPSEVPSPFEVEENAKALVVRAENETGTHADDVNVFKSLNTFVIKASPKLVHYLRDQPEVARSMANRRPPEESKRSRAPSS